MPYSALDRVELHTKKVLVDFQNRRHNHGDREVLFYEHIVQVEGLLNVLPIVVTVVPEVEFPVIGKARFFMFLLLHFEEDGLLLLTHRSKLALQVIEELDTQFQTV